MNNGIYAGPPVTKKPCVHDSRRLDGWLDTCCMKCGADGYWRRAATFFPSIWTPTFTPAARFSSARRSLGGRVRSRVC